MALIESHRVPDPCCHSCPALIAMHNLRLSIKTGYKAKKGSVCMCGQSEPLEKRSKKAFREEGRGKKEKAGGRAGQKGERREEKGEPRWKAERGRTKRKGKGRKAKLFFICMMGDLKSLSALKHPAAWQFTHTLSLY